MGGLARRASYLSDLHKRYPQLLVFDSGDSLEGGKPDNFSDLKNRVMARGHNLSGYSALNVAARELKGGVKSLREYAKVLDAPLISSNIVPQDGETPIWKPWVIQQIGDLRVAVLGVVSPKFLDIETLTNQGVDVHPMVPSLQKLLPEVRAQADLVVLLANTGLAGARRIASQFHNDIDLILVGRDSYQSYDYEKVNDTYLFKNSRNGQHLNVIKCYMAQNHLGKVVEDLVPLDDSIKTGMTFVEPILKYKQEVRARKKALRYKKDPAYKAIEKYKDMSPQEFMDLMKQQSTIPPINKQG